jgi:sugar O-acyltransferase (sialic acid O-acetyltransferase NeuD family)
MKHRLIILSASGLGREYFHLAKAIAKNNPSTVWEPYGFLDDRTGILEGKNLEGTPILDTIENYTPKENDRFVCAIGDPSERHRYFKIIFDKGGIFARIISPQASICSGRKIGRGVVICSNALISCDVVVGAHTFINNHTTVGHDVEVGRFCHIGGHVFIGGNTRIGNRVVIHPGATILPGLNIGNRAVIGAGSVVVKDVKEGDTVFGVPARVVQY